MPPRSTARSKSSKRARRLDSESIRAARPREESDGCARSKLAWERWISGVGSHARARPSRFGEAAVDEDRGGARYLSPPQNF